MYVIRAQCRCVDGAQGRALKGASRVWIFGAGAAPVRLTQGVKIRAAGCRGVEARLAHRHPGIAREFFCADVSGLHRAGGAWPA